MVLVIFGEELLTEAFLFSIFMVIVNMYFGAFFNRHKKIVGVIMGIGLIIIFWIWQRQKITGIGNVVVCFLILLLLSHSWFQGKIINKIALNIMFVVMWVITELFVGYLIYDRYADIHGGEYVSTITLFLIVMVIRKYFSNYFIADVPIQHMILLLLIPAYSMFISYGMFLAVLESTIRKSMVIWAVLSLLGLLLINILVYYYYLRLIRDKVNYEKSIIYENQLRVIENNQKEQSKSIERFCELKHNYINDMLAMKSYIEGEEFREASQLIKSRISIISEGEEAISKTGNLFVDSTINNRYFGALNKNVVFHIDIMIPSNLPFRGSDLSLIIGNILDNALEATLQLPVEKRYIKIRMKYERKYLKMIITNSYSGQVKHQKNGKLLTLKKNKDEHGLGLLAIEEATKKYRGFIDYEMDHNHFVTKVLLYSPMEKLPE